MRNVTFGKRSSTFVSKLDSLLPIFSFFPISSLTIFPLFIGTKIRVGASNANEGYLRLDCFTAKAEWLDVVEVHAVNVGQGTLRVRVKSFSSGFVPTSCPLGPLFSALFCWFPFSDHTENVGCLLVWFPRVAIIFFVNFSSVSPVGIAERLPGQMRAGGRGEQVEH